METEVLKVPAKKKAVYAKGLLLHRRLYTLLTISEIFDDDDDDDDDMNEIDDDG